MSTATNVIVKPKYPEVNIKEAHACTLMLSKELVQKIHYLHHVVQKGIEWSGTLLFKEPEGDVSNPSTWVISAEDLILMDIGTSGYTEYDISTEHPNSDAIMDAMVDDFKLGHIHTHHNMG